MNRIINKWKARDRVEVRLNRPVKVEVLKAPIQENFQLILKKMKHHKKKLKRMIK